MTGEPGGEWRLPVGLDELDAAFSALLEAARREWGQEVVLDEDIYWNLRAEQRFDLTEDPTFDVGSLADDVEEVREMLARGEVHLWHDLAHFIGILQALAAMDRPAEHPSDAE